MIAKTPFRSTSVALTGTTHATLLAAPPEGEAYIVRQVYGFNTSGGNRAFTLHINKASTVTPLWVRTVVADGTMFTPNAAGSDPHDFCIVLADTDESLEIDLDGTGTDVVYAFYEVVESKNFGSTSVALSGTTNVTLLAAPPAGVSYRVFRAFGINTSGGNRTLQLYFNKATAVTAIWFALSAPTTNPLFVADGGTPQLFEIYLGDTDESLEADLTDTGTDRIFCFYEVLES